MLIVLKAIAALVIDLCICYCSGSLLLTLLHKNDTGLPLATLLGFVLNQCIFEVLTLGSYFMHRTLSFVSCTWSIIAGLLVVCRIVLVIVNRKRDLPRKQWMRSEWILFALVCAVTALLCYYVSINGELNEDSRYYIGLVNTTVSTNALFQYNATNGQLGNSWYLRRALATYEIQSATICQVFQIPALVTTRIMRASETVVLLALATYELGKRILWRGEEGEKKSYALVIVNLVLQLVFAGTYSSSASFLLLRAYEGKAIVSVVLVVVMMLLCSIWLEERDKRVWILLILTIWGGAAISSSGLVIMMLECALILGASVVIKHVR